jgi:hypothetical protein
MVAIVLGDSGNSTQVESSDIYSPHLQHQYLLSISGGFEIGLIYL